MESAGEGQGSIFVVNLPLISSGMVGAERPQPASVEVNGNEYASLAGIRVLLVDDEPDSNEGASPAPPAGSDRG